MTPSESIVSLHLVVRAESEGIFRVQCSNVGNSVVAEALFSAPLSEQSIFRLSYKMAGSRRYTRARYYTDEDRKLAEDVGTGLFKTLFDGDIEREYRRAVDAAQEQHGAIRIVLDLTGAPALMNYPWEFLYDPMEGTYLARSAETSLIRLVDLGRPIAPKQVTLPLRVLLVSATPEGLPELRIDEEVTTLRNVTQRVNSIAIEVLSNPTLAALNDALEKVGRGHFDVLHYIGHGGFHRDRNIGTLSFADEQNRVDDVNPDRFAEVVRNKGIQLVVLNACEGARTGIEDPFAGVALNLMRARVPAVIAMQFEITDSAAIAFSKSLYIAIADGLPIDKAVSRARSRVVVGQETLEWATPVLFLQAASPQLFRIATPLRVESIRADDESSQLEAHRRADEETAAREAQRRANEEAERMEAQRRANKETEKMEAQRRANEEAEKMEAQRRANEEAAKLEAQRRTDEQAAKLEAKRRGSEEAAKVESKSKLRATPVAALPVVGGSSSSLLWSVRFFCYDRLQHVHRKVASTYAGRASRARSRKTPSRRTTHGAARHRPRLIW